MIISNTFARLRFRMKTTLKLRDDGLVTPKHVILWRLPETVLLIIHA